MADLLEVVFESVLESKVIQLLMFIVSGADKVIDIECTEDREFLEDGKLSTQKLESFLNYPDDASVLIKLKDLKVGSIKLPLAMLRLIKYGDQFDIDFNFDKTDIDDVSMTFLTKTLHEYVAKLGKDHEVSHWFFGMEPASDEDTRYFTDNELGPLI